MSTQTPPRPAKTERGLHTRLEDVPGVELSQVRASTSTGLYAWIAVGVAVAAVVWLAMDTLALGVVLGFVTYAVGVYVTYRITSGPRVGTDQFMRALVYGAFLVAVIPLVSLLWTVVSNGWSLFVSPDFWTSSMNRVTGVYDQATVEDGAPVVGGAYHAIIGTLIITGLATVISVPIGLLTAIYLVEYGARRRLSHAIRFFVDVMTGIPSIVAGLFAFALFGTLFGIGTKNGLAGAVALSVLMIPTVVRNSEEMLRIVPNELREASLALGVPKWRTIVKVVLPTAASGLAAGVTLAIARIIGETAPLLVAVGAFYKINVNPFEGPMHTLAVYAYDMFTKPLNPGFPDPSRDRAWAAALILVIIVIALNLAARFIARLFAPKTGR